MRTQCYTCIKYLNKTCKGTNNIDICTSFLRHKKANNILQNIIVLVLILLICAGALYINYNWTKKSLEDIAGKEVSTSTVIWKMVDRNKN